MRRELLHAGMIAARSRGSWAGVLLEGASGAGKSDLALRALDDGFRLVSDDRTVIWESGGVLFGRCPDPIAGLIEARGCGVLGEPAIPLAAVVLAVECVDPSYPLERLPDARHRLIAGVRTPALRLRAFESSACAKLRRALRHLGGAGQEAYHTASLGGGGRAGTGDTH